MKMRYWITKDTRRGILVIKLERFIKLSLIKDELNDKIKNEWPDATNWPRKFTKKISISSDMISGEIEVPEENFNFASFSDAKISSLKKVEV